jgi:hypothetical protein
MDKEYLNAAVTFLVGLVALVVYLLQKRTELQNAAIIIVMDVRHAETVVHSILEQGQVTNRTGIVLRENNWSKYKHLFAGKLSTDDFAAFNRFFDSCAEMTEARGRMGEVFYAALDEKSRLLQEKLYDVAEEEPAARQKVMQKLFDKINAETFLFNPSEPMERVLKGLQTMGRLSTTPGFEKLKKIGGNQL